MNRTPLQNLLKLKLFSGSSQLEELTATGNPAKFSTDVGRSLKQCLVPISSESGISGLTVWHTGRNLIDDSIKYQQSSTSCAVGNEYDYTIPLKAGTYTFSVEFAENAHYSAYIREKNQSENTVLWYSAGTETEKTFTLSSDGFYRIWFYNGSGAPTSNIEKCQLEASSTPREYEPYNGSTYTVTFPESIESGTVDLITGVLTETAPESKTVQLEPVSISALVGDNVIFSDQTGNLTVKYLKKVGT